MIAMAAILGDTDAETDEAVRTRSNPLLSTELIWVETVTVPAAIAARDDVTAYAYSEKPQLATTTFAAYVGGADGCAVAQSAVDALDAGDETPTTARSVRAPIGVGRVPHAPRRVALFRDKRV